MPRATYEACTLRPSHHGWISLFSKGVQYFNQSNTVTEAECIPTRCKDYKVVVYCILILDQVTSVYENMDLGKSLGSGSKQS